MDENIKMTLAIGIILIVTSIVIAIYWLATGKRNKPLFRFVCVFTAIMGFLLVLKDKLVEVTFKDVISIKTSAAKASADAEVIAKVKQQVENQRATIDLVATEAQKAKNISEDASNKVMLAEQKLITLDDAIQKANEALGKLNAATEFSLLIAKAQNDDRDAFIQLIKISMTNNSPYAQSAKNIVNSILHETETQTVIEDNAVTIHWDIYGIDPDKDTLQKLTDFYSAHPDSVLIRFNVVKQIFNASRFSERERFDFVAKVMQTDKSLRILQLCCNLMTPKSNIRLNLLGADVYLQWEANNRESFTNSPTSSLPVSK